MDNQEILSIYRDVALITDQMLVAARNEDWDSLVALESHCARHIDTLKSRARIAPLSDENRQQKIDIIRKILADDNEIRGLTEPRLVKLTSLISNSGNERRLQKAYSANSAG